MKKQDNRSPIRWWTLSLGLALFCGCGGALRSAAIEHAEASRSVALTLTRTTAGLHCEGLKDDAATQCKGSIGVIEQQAQALRDSADRLQRTAK